MAEHMSKVAVSNAILRRPKKLDDKHVVWSTFTQPELARLGESKDDLRKRGLDRAILDGETDGLVKLFTSERGWIWELQSWVRTRERRLPIRSGDAQQVTRFRHRRNDSPVPYL